MMENLVPLETIVLCICSLICNDPLMCLRFDIKYQEKSSSGLKRLNGTGRSHANLFKASATSASSFSLLTH